jgi:IclR family pca regulon transcriptional regulator
MIAARLDFARKNAFMLTCTHSAPIQTLTQGIRHVTLGASVYHAYRMSAVRTSGEDPAAGATRYFINSIAKAFQILEVFTADTSRLNLTDLARLSGLNKATARRIALTLCDVGYLRQVGTRHFTLTPKVLDLGAHFLQSLSVPELAEPYLTELAARTHESVNLAVRDGVEVLYVNRIAAAQRILTVNLHVGSRLPLHATSLGKALLMDFGRSGLVELLGEPPWRSYTPATHTGPDQLLADLDEARKLGCAFADGELEPGLRSIAAPIRGPEGKIVAAINISTHSLRTGLDQLFGPMREDLVATAAEVSQAAGYRAKP